MPKLGRFTDARAAADFDRAYERLSARWPVPYADLDVETAYGTTRVRRSGSGEGAPLLLLPGMPGNGMVWLPFVEQFAGDRVVFTPDVIGWAGRCEQRAPLRDAGDVARWITGVLDGLGLERVHLAGNSMGSWFALVTAARQPESSRRLASVTMIEPGGATFTKPRLRVLLKFLAAGIRPTRARMEKFNRWLLPGYRPAEEDWEMIMACLKFRPGMPWERPLTDAELAGVTAPLLVLFGAETVAGDAEAAARIVRAKVPGAIAEIYPGVGHDLLWSNPDEVLPRIRRFLGEHDPALR